MMFTRLDEMRVGDYFYIEVMGRTLGYKVDRISVIEPNDTSTLKIVPGEDRVTLMTCTPYGVNTHRLLVSAVRAPIPGVVPEERNAAKDARTIAIAAWFVAGLAVQAAVAYSQTCGLVAEARLTWLLHEGVSDMQFEYKNVVGAQKNA